MSIGSARFVLMDISLSKIFWQGGGERSGICTTSCSPAREGNRYSDPNIADNEGVNVAINGVPQHACTGLGNDCEYHAQDGDTVTLLNPGWSEFPDVNVYSWGSTPCASAPLEGPCSFTASADVGFNLLLQPFCRRRACAC